MSHVKVNLVAFNLIYLSLDWIKLSCEKKMFACIRFCENFMNFQWMCSIFYLHTQNNAFSSVKINFLPLAKRIFQISSFFNIQKKNSPYLSCTYSHVIVVLFSIPARTYVLHQTYYLYLDNRCKHKWKENIHQNHEFII